MDTTTDRIIPLEQLDDFKVADGDPDVRGWEVLSADGQKVGEVDDLLIDRGAMKVRYLDVDIDDELVSREDDRHILIPIGYARLDEDSDRIFVDSLNTGMVADIPRYRHESLNREFERSLHSFFSTDFDDAGDRDFYAYEGYDEDRFYAPRRGQRTGTDDRILER